MIRTTLSQANNFVLQKNYLAAEKAPSITELVEQLAGLPAEPSSTPYLSACVRLTDFTPNQLLIELNQTRSLIKGSFMRSTPYIVNTNRYIVWHAATARQRKHDFNAEFRLWGIETNDEIERLGQSILSIFGDQPLTSEVITGRLPKDLVQELTQTSRGGRVTKTNNMALTLRWLVSKGVLGVSNDSADWRVENPIYARLNHWYPDLDLSSAPGEADAQKTLVRAYLAAFGPATEADISFWTGFGKSETARAIAALSSETTLTMVEGIPGMLLTLKSQADILQATEIPVGPVINILPADDPLITAHRASRVLYMADQKLQRQIFSSSGAAKPTILVDGQVVGLWDWHTESGRDEITWQLLTKVDSEIVALIQAEMERIAVFIHPDAVIHQKAA